MSRALVMPRGINVGARNRVPMAGLRDVLEDAGFDDVETVLQSGNVIVTLPGSSGADEVSAKVAKLIKKNFDVDVPCVARSATELEAIAKSNPLRDVAKDGSMYLVTFLSEKPSAEEAKKLSSEYFSPEVVRVDGQEVYVWTPEGVKGMKCSYSYLEKRLGCHATARNWNTLEKIISKL